MVHYAGILPEHNSGQQIEHMVTLGKEIPYAEIIKSLWVIK
jgi:hypothetical protein